jgi:hypothetical protein
VLGVDAEAPQEVIAAAFKQQALLNHPDRRPGDELAAGRMAKINEAYEVLRDPERRRRYDRDRGLEDRGAQAQGPARPQPPPPPPPPARPPEPEQPAVPCAAHERAEAVTYCAECGASLCQGCATARAVAVCEACYPDWLRREPLRILARAGACSVSYLAAVAALSWGLGHLVGRVAVIEAAVIAELVLCAALGTRVVTRWVGEQQYVPLIPVDGARLRYTALLVVLLPAGAAMGLVLEVRWVIRSVRQLRELARLRKRTETEVRE